MKLLRAIGLTAILGVFLAGPALAAPPGADLGPAGGQVAPAAPLAASGACSTGLANVGGQGIICDITIVNTITATGGSATVTVHECQGSAGDPTDGSMAGGHACTTTTSTVLAPVTAVTQCDGSANGGGGKLLCSVVITNNFVGISPGSGAVTVNQCVGSVTTGTVMACNPFPATTSGAAIIQCNGSANGGGASLTCVATGTMASALAVSIDQCNGSANGGGATAVCSASMVNNALPASPSGSAASPSGSVGTSSTPPPTSTSGPQDRGSGPVPWTMLLLASLAAGAAFLTIRRLAAVRR